ncbi:MAG: anhydro-N-acetylmuramic acid kinase [Pseudomonadota bacterium]
MSKKGIEALSAMAHKDERLILGLMSGTSLDGLDLALCRIEGHGPKSRLTLKAFTTRPYDDDFKTRVREVFAKRQIDLQHLTLLHPTIAEVHAAMILTTLEAWDISANTIDLIASHGQTVYHAPRSFHGDPAQPHATLQLGDGDHIAQRTGIITCSDFRQKHIAAGGEGAPLAAYGDILLFTDDKKDRALINVGGISNFTLVPSQMSHLKAFSSDIGPGNTIMDALAQRDFDMPYDADATIAKRGNIRPDLLQAMLNEPFFGLACPKTTGPEHFSLSWAEGFGNALPEDMMATLNRLTAETIADAIKALSSDTLEVYLSGGGAHNPLLKEHLANLLPGIPITTTDALGVNPDAKEAMLFALLANELVAGEQETFADRLDGGPAVTMGKISLPD